MSKAKTEKKPRWEHTAAGYDCAVQLLPADADTKVTDGALREQAAACPIFMSGGAFLAPGVLDAFDRTAGGKGEWYPNSHRTRLLCAAVHAAKDIATFARALDPSDPWKDKRAVALLATPLVNMCDRTKELCDRLGQETGDRAHWPPADLDLLREATRRMKRHQSSALRTLRHTHTAHIDLDVLRPDASDLGSLQELILPPFGDTLLLLLLSVNYRRVYTWRRKPADASAEEIEIMTEYPLAIRAKLNAEGAICALGGFSTIAADPRGPLRDAVLALFPVYNALAAKADPRHPTIFWQEREEPK